VSEVWVANASPVIVLAKAGHLGLLKQLTDELILPEAVAAEVLAGPESDPARQALEGGWGVRQAPREVSSGLLEWGLGPGETAVLALARERAPATAILDDAAARACAKAFGVPLLGSLGVVLRAKKRSLVPQAVEVLKAIRAAGIKPGRPHHPAGPGTGRRNLVRTRLKPFRGRALPRIRGRVTTAYPFRCRRMKASAFCWASSAAFLSPPVSP
jgi:predicted nucleic acid-binding protein